MNPRLWTIWAAFFATQVLYAAIGSFAGPPVVASPMAWVFPIVALGPAALSIAWGRVIGVGQPVQSTWLVRWALIESVSLFALVDRMTGGPPAAVWPTFVAGWSLMLAQAPRDVA